MTAQKIGIFAGTFDPIHDGHVAFADAARQQAGLDKVVFLPEPKPRRKTNVTPVQQRLAVIERRIDRVDHLEAKLINQPVFTVDRTLPELSRLYPSADLTLLIGSDIVPQLHYWQHFETIRSSMKIIVGLRQDSNTSDLSTYLDTLGTSYQFIKTEFAQLSSSQFRN